MRHFQASVCQVWRVNPGPVADRPNEHYASYLRAAVSRIGSQAGLGRSVQRATFRRITDRLNLYRRGPGGDAAAALLEARTENFEIGTSKVAAWIARSSIPTIDGVPFDDRRLVVDALIEVVDLHVGTLDGLPPFSRVVDDLRGLRARSRHRSRPVQKPSVPVLVDPKSPGSALDGLRLGLGSWVTPDTVPDHVPRAVDRELRDRLERALTAPAGWDRLVVITGSPKVGKTRSAFEAIRSLARDRRVWWPVLRRGVLAGLMSPAPDDEVVIVLDDLQVLDPAMPDELSADLLFALVQRAGAVVCTIHSAALSTWTLNAVGERHRPYDRRLVEQLTQRSIRVAATLTKEESSQPSPTLARLHDAGFGLEHLRLAEALAAVEHLHALCEVARADDDHVTRWPLTLAGVDAHHLLPGGATSEELTFLFMLRWGALHPGTDYPTDIQDAIRWATRTIGTPGSPHSVLMKTPSATSADDEFRLLDALADRLEPVWDPLHLRPLPGMPDRLLFACAYKLRGSHDSQPWIEAMSRPFRHDLLAMIGRNAELRGEVEVAKVRYEAACDLATGEANLFLGRLLLAEGAVAEATIVLERLVAADEVAAHLRGSGLFELALAAGGSAGGDSARLLYERAASFGDGRALYNLGVWDLDDRNLAAAWNWFEQAEAAGVPEATVVLARLEREQGLVRDGLTRREDSLLPLAEGGFVDAIEEAWQYAIASESDPERRRWASPKASALAASLSDSEADASVSSKETHLNLLVRLAEILHNATHDGPEVREAAAADIRRALSHLQAVMTRLADNPTTGGPAREEGVDQPS